MSNEIDTYRAEALANKLDSINQYFGVAESTISEISKHLQLDNKINIVDNCEIVEKDIEDDSIIDIKTLKDDFITIRNTLLDTIDNGKRVIGTITSNVVDLGSIEDPDMISAYASLVGTVNSSLKLLTETYKNIISMQKMINENKKINGKNNQEGTVNNLTINTINTTVDDIIKKMRNKDVLESK